MKIIFTGGGSGGHFYPIISVVQGMRDILKEQKIIKPKMYFLAPHPYNKGLLFDNDIIYKKVFAGKKRLYKSPLAIFDYIKTVIGIIKAIWTIFWIYPDIIFSKGGYGSFPVVFAGRILRIPVMIHESDSELGRANVWASSFAKKIAVSYPDAGKSLPQDKVAWTGSPIREDIRQKVTEGAHEFLDFEKDTPTIFIMGGSQGAKVINDAILDSLELLVEKYQIVHQTGKNNFEEVTRTADLILNTSPYRARYKPYDYMNDLGIRMSAGAADIIISRAGSTIFEIANWGVPSIIIPITESANNHQHKNAFNYARSGGAIVIEENNLNSEILLSEIDRILTDQNRVERMETGAKSFAKPDAGKKIAEEILELIISHEQ